MKGAAEWPRKMQRSPNGTTMRFPLTLEQERHLCRLIDDLTKNRAVAWSVREQFKALRENPPLRHALNMAHAKLRKRDAALPREPGASKETQ